MMHILKYNVGFLSLKTLDSILHENKVLTMSCDDRKLHAQIWHTANPRGNQTFSVMEFRPSSLKIHLSLNPKKN